MISRSSPARLPWLVAQIFEAGRDIGTLLGDFNPNLGEHARDDRPREKREFGGGIINVETRGIFCLVTLGRSCGSDPRFTDLDSQIQFLASLSANLEASIRLKKVARCHLFLFPDRCMSFVYVVHTSLCLDATRQSSSDAILPEYRNIILRPGHLLARTTCKHNPSLRLSCWFRNSDYLSGQPLAMLVEGSEPVETPESQQRRPLTVLGSDEITLLNLFFDLDSYSYRWLSGSASAEKLANDPQTVCFLMEMVRYYGLA